MSTYCASLGPCPRLIRPPKTSRLPDIVTVEQAQALFAATRTLSYRVFFFTVYSLGLRLSECLALRVADIDAQRLRVQVRDSKGNRDRFVPLPAATLLTLRRFWQEHRNPELLFPHRHGGLLGAALASTPLDRGGVQRALRQVALACGIKKKIKLAKVGLGHGGGQPRSHLPRRPRLVQTCLRSPAPRRNQFPENCAGMLSVFCGMWALGEWLLFASPNRAVGR